MALAVQAALDRQVINMNRKQRRQLGKVAGKDAASKIDLMLSIPSECLTCKKPYDKTSKEMAMTWTVKVYESLKRVDLFCPECIKAESDGIRKE